MTRLLPLITSLLLVALAMNAPGVHANTLTVLNSADSGPFSLRQAIVAANSNPDADVITFNIAGSGPFTINLLSPLPTLTTAMTIDGYTQPGAGANSLTQGDNAVIKIRLDGAAAGGASNGLAVCASLVTVRGLSITRFAVSGVSIGSDAGNGACPTAPTGAVIAGNFIGLAADGDAPAGNLFAGVRLSNCTNTRIGGGAPADRNLISANGAAGPDGYGIQVSGAGTVNNGVTGNYIGTDRTGNLDRGNAKAGVQLEGGATNESIGDDIAPNRIAYNQTGIVVLPGASTHTFFANDFSHNDVLGIDLCATTSCPDGVTENDLNDPDSGGNGLQNFPVITSANVAGNVIDVAGSVDRTNAAGTRVFAIAVYANASCDGSGHGQGEHYLGSFEFTSTGPTAESFVGTVSGEYPAGTPISVTASNRDTGSVRGDTSEFSTCTNLVARAPITVVNNNDSGAGSLRDAINQANGHAGPDIIAFNIPGAGVHTIIPATTPLPTLVGPAMIDGYSQPGASANTSTTASNAVIAIEISAPNLGLLLDGTNATLRGLAIFGAPTSVTGVTLVGTGHRVEGCFIGLRADGVTPAGLPILGISAVNGSGHHIGGALPAQRNVIASNGGGANGIGGMQLQSTTAVEIDGNLFGTDRSGALARGNLPFAITTKLGANSVRIGSQAPNLIRFNTTGVLVEGASFGIETYANDYADNSGLAIDLSAVQGAPDGLTLNDANDADSGANTLQNFPVLNAANQVGADLNVTGSLDVPINGSLSATLAFYASAACEANGHGEGAAYLGAVDRVISNSAENFSVTLAGVSLPAGSKITATATVAGNTSEFSACLNFSDAEAVFKSGFE